MRGGRERGRAVRLGRGMEVPRRRRAEVVVLFWQRRGHQQEVEGRSVACCPATSPGSVRTKCQSCHGTTPINGAPVSLVTYEDTQAAGVKDSSRPVWQSMQTRVHSTTMTVMPPRNQPALTSVELASLDSWFAAGAPAGTQQACMAAGTGGIAGGSGDGGSGGRRRRSNAERENGSPAPVAPAGRPVASDRNFSPARQATP